MGGYNPNRIYDSNGPEIKIRGTASHVYEKYLQLARDANASGDRIMAENYLQHAEHYFRIMAAGAAQAQAQAQAQQVQGQQIQGQQPVLPGTGMQPRLPNGTEEQPYVEPSEPTAQTSAPSFSLNETVGIGDAEEDGNDSEDVGTEEQTAG
jgi:hypothetical protein